MSLREHKKGKVLPSQLNEGPRRVVEVDERADTTIAPVDRDGRSFRDVGAIQRVGPSAATEH